MHGLVGFSSGIDSKDIDNVRRLESHRLASRFGLHGQNRQEDAVVEFHRHAVLRRSKDVDLPFYVAFVDPVRDRSRASVRVFALLGKDGRVLGIFKNLAHDEPWQQDRVDFPF